MKIFHFQQQDRMDCGPTCLRIVAKYYGRNIDIYKLRKLCQINQDGVSMLGISEAAEKIGFRSQMLRLSLSRLQEVQLPAILHWRQNHFVVLFKIKKGKYYISDPEIGIETLNTAEFTKAWIPHDKSINGIALQLSPTPDFYQENEDEKSEKLGWNTVFQYFIVYRSLFFQLMLGLLLGTALQLIVPFLTQSVVDIGINTKNINFVYLILIAQIMLFFGQAAINFIRSWILLHISTRVNIAILTDLLIKLMKLPMSFFETKTTGDILQRMEDQSRVESFLTGSTLSTLFSFTNLIVFGVVLGIYNMGIFSVFFISSILYACWILLFLKKRRQLDKKRFLILSEKQTKTIELINGIREIKLNNSEKQKRWMWESIQARLFRFKIKSLALSQYQEAGSIAINQLKGIFITFLSAKAVIDGDITLGAMMAIQYIVGMASNPIEQFLSVVRSYQDAKISLERINEIYREEDEENVEQEFIDGLPNSKTISLINATFVYPGAGNAPVLKNLNLLFPEGKTTAIVGSSGCGKTTILKLILRFYELTEGDIKIGNTNLKRIGYKLWRDECGVVMQDGFIFADTIENNIAVGRDYIDYNKLAEAIRIANLQDFVDAQPFGLRTRIGTAGRGISQGQKQRILIARAVYKNPHYILFDEATNALDANNERIIIENLREFFLNRTVIIVAHRLSTVRNADNIILLDRGSVVEQGTHQELLLLKGEYYKLVKNQLELEKK